MLNLKPRQVSITAYFLENLQIKFNPNREELILQPLFLRADRLILIINERKDTNIRVRFLGESAKQYMIIDHLDGLKGSFAMKNQLNKDWQNKLLVTQILNNQDHVCIKTVQL